MDATNRKPRPIENPQPCRYCGHVATDHAHERGLYGTPDYTCRDVGACGDRLRARKTPGQLATDAASGLPF